MAARSRRKKYGVFGKGKPNSQSAEDRHPEGLQLVDVLCCVCRSVLVEPVSLPCLHRFCRSCWLSTDTLRCLLCRKRVGSWLRESARRNHLVDEDLWRTIRVKFSTELANKIKGVDIALSEEPVPRQLSAPGEIRAEYEAELQRLHAERLQLEQKHSSEAEQLAQKLQDEEEQAHEAYLEKLKQDEKLARQLQAAEDEKAKSVGHLNVTLRSTPAKVPKHSNKKNTLERYLIHKPVQKKTSPKLSLDINKVQTNGRNTSSVESGSSSSVLPNHGCFLNDYLNKKLKHLTSSMMKNDRDIHTVKKWTPINKTGSCGAQKEFSFSEGQVVIRTKGARKQLCPDPTSTSLSTTASIPSTSSLNKNVAALIRESKHDSSSDSVDSMRQELCYFKPIQAQMVSWNKLGQKEPVRVPAIRSKPVDRVLTPPRPPDYLHGLQLLRGDSTASAFACLYHLKEAANCDISQVNVRPKKTVYKPQIKELPPYSFRRKPSTIKESVSKPDKPQRLRRTRSTGNIPKLATPKKQSPRKVFRDSRVSKSDTKVLNGRHESTPLKVGFGVDRLNLVTKNLSSPMEKRNAVILGKDKCDESYSIENNNNLTKMLTRRSSTARVTADTEKVKRDLELSLRVEAEWNGGYSLRRAPAKRRHIAPPHPLIMARKKKLKCN